MTALILRDIHECVRAIALICARVSALLVRICIQAALCGPGARQKEGFLTCCFGHVTAAFAVRESDSRLKRCWRAYLDTGNTLHERQQVRRNDAGVPRYNSIMCTHTQYYVTHDVLFHLTTSVGIFSQALKGIERALASSQRLEEEERAAREMHQECMQASKIYEQLLDTAAKVYADSIVDASAPQHRWV